MQDEQWLTTVYRHSFPQAARVVQQLGGDLETAKDLFHDALIIYMEKLRNNTLHINSAPNAYLVGITKMLWYQQCRNDRKYISLDERGIDIAIPEDFYVANKEDVSALQYLRVAGQKCMQLLQAFYYEQLSMEKIASVFNYKTSRSATVQKHKCLEKIREQVKQTEAYEKRIA